MRIKRIDLDRLDLRPLKPSAFISIDYANGWNDMLRKILGEKLPQEAHMRMERKSRLCSCSKCRCAVDVTDEYCRRCGAHFINIRYFEED